jgi:hypothetical protein
MQVKQYKKCNISLTEGHVFASDQRERSNLINLCTASGDCFVAALLAKTAPTKD